METDITFQAIPACVQESLVEDRVLLKVFYQANSYMTYQTEGVFKFLSLSSLAKHSFSPPPPPPSSLPPPPSISLVPSSSFSLSAVYEIADNLVPQFVPEDPAKRERLGLPEDM